MRVAVPAREAKKKTAPPDVTGWRVTPFTILVDSREQAPYEFLNLRTNADDGNRLILPQIERRGLETGDYSLDGFEHCVAIERKSLEDLYSTLGQRRELFQREHERMSDLILEVSGCCAVVIEAGMAEGLQNPPLESQLDPKTVHRTMLSWFEKYAVPWFWCGSRRLAELTTFRLLEVFWKHRQEG